MGCREAGPAQAKHELRGANEPAPVMRAPRQPTQDIFGADDRQRERARSAIERRADKDAAGLNEGTEGGEEGIAIGDVLDDFEREDDVKAFAGACQRLDIRNPIIDRQPTRQGVGAGGGDRGPAGIDAGDGETEPGHRLGHEAAATADVREAQAGERRERARITLKMREELAADEIDADGIYLVERPEAARLIPPARTLRGETVDILRVYAVADFSHLAEPAIAAE